MNKHTPGPWFVDAHNNVLAEGCLVAFPSVAAGLEKQEANARLIAAAPELLGALQKAVARQGFSNDELRDARAAITKAKGVTP